MMGSERGSDSAALRASPGSDLQSIASELRKILTKAVAETLGDSILLSGGLDTSVVSAIVSSLLGEQGMAGFRAYTVVLKDAPSPDLEFSKIVSGLFRMPHQIHSAGLSELEESLPDVIGVLKSFDPMEIRNSIAVYVGMKQAKLDDCSKIMTGDASDELFGGYSFVFNQSEEKARETLAHLWQVMHFSSIQLASSLGMEARLPFLHPDVKELAMNRIDFVYLAGRRNGSGELFGKFVLRKAFEDMLPAEIVWRTKTPIERGSGTTILPLWYSNLVKDAEFADKRRRYLQEDSVRLRDKEQLRYYEIYRRILGPPAPQDRSLRSCPACTSNVPDVATFCTTCGEHPI